MNKAVIHLPFKSFRYTIVVFFSKDTTMKDLMLEFDCNSNKSQIHDNNNILKGMKI